MNKDVAYVFVVCGAKQHIDTLHFSIKSLKKFTSYPIWVVTDIKRNESQIIHDNIIDVSTPESFSHHQASIWLKTSLHRIMPQGKIYCYLDSDVIALNEDCNQIFEEYIQPISFANDHTSVSFFSPYAVNCSCIENFNKERDAFNYKVSTIIKHSHFPPDFNQNEVRLLFRFQKSLLKSRFRLFNFAFRFIIALILGKSKINKVIKLDVRNKCWVINNKYVYPILLLNRKEIRKKAGYSFSFLKHCWLNNNGEKLPENKCSHLCQALKDAFNIEVPCNWQHWNGGVFLFDDSSHVFMEQWHQNTLLIFGDSFWKVRDQGTLIATVFQNNLQQHPTLPEKFNFIADFYKTEIQASDQKNIFIKGEEKIKPSFIHIYHHWGDNQWDVWQHVIKILEEK